MAGFATGFALFMAAAKALLRSPRFFADGTFGSCFGITGFGARTESETGFTGVTGCTTAGFLLVLATGLDVRLSGEAGKVVGDISEPARRGGLLGNGTCWRELASSMPAGFIITGTDERVSPSTLSVETGVAIFGVTNPGAGEFVTIFFTGTVGSWNLTMICSTSARGWANCSRDAAIISSTYEVSGCGMASSVWAENGADFGADDASPITACVSVVVALGIEMEEKSHTPQSHSSEYTRTSIEKLNEMLMQAIDKEDYESAARIRDEINKRS